MDGVVRLEPVLETAMEWDGEWAVRGDSAGGIGRRAGWGSGIIAVMVHGDDPPAASYLVV